MERPNVLFVDDDEAVLSLAARILRKAEFPVCTADSAAKALAILSTRNIGIMIYDLSVGGQAGAFNFLSSVHQSQPSLSIMLITGYASPETVEEAQRLEIRLLEKPFGSTELLAQMSYLMARRKNTAA
jgi:DNA-binding NtrC family response regulator